LEGRTGNDRRIVGVTTGSAIRTHSLSKTKNRFVVRDRPTHTASKMVHSCPRLVIAWGRIGEVVRRIQQRSIPQFVKISVKLVRPGLGHIIDLRRSIPPLIHGIGKSVDRYFRNRIQSQNEVGGKAAI